MLVSALQDGYLLSVLISALRMRRVYFLRLCSFPLSVQ